MPDAVGVRGRVGIAEPEDGDCRVDALESDFEERVDDVAVAGAVGHGRGRRRTQLLQYRFTQHRGERVVVVDDAAAGHRVIEQER